ncbi:hypothetical protein FRC07_003230 [Ceratobasidium sp. 392]|nr:hypothetical protein FRC07_003230 [Ceratobasidium sp. 392]
MQSPGKKRKLQAVVPPANPEADRKLLRAFLKQSDDTCFVETLADSLEYASAEQLESLKSLLHGVLAGFEPKLHCVRCHESYLESENGRDACQIPHSDAEGVAQDKWDELWAGFECCGKDFDEENLICIYDRHATDESDVIYYGDEGVDEYDEHFAQNENVQRCRDKGCDLD